MQGKAGEGTGDEGARMRFWGWGARPHGKAEKQGSLRQGVRAGDETGRNAGDRGRGWGAGRGAEDEDRVGVRGWGLGQGYQDGRLGTGVGVQKDAGDRGRKRSPGKGVKERGTRVADAQAGGQKGAGEGGAGE